MDKLPHFTPETLRLAEEALKRKPLTHDEAIAAGVDFILNCPLGESSTVDAFRKIV